MDAGGQESIYSDRAELYDLVYHWKDYRAESEALHALLAREGVPDGARLLEAACGTGTHLDLLARWYRVTGFDVSEGMLAVARRKFPKLPLFRADLRDFEVEEPHDVATCLFSSIGYLLDEAGLRAAAERLALAVRPGGVLVVEPWFGPDNWDVGRPTLQTAETADVKVARACVASRDGDLAVMDMEYVVARRGAPAAEHFRERHVMWLCPRDLLGRAFADAGFDVRFEPDGLMPERGLLLGRRR